MNERPSSGFRRGGGSGCDAVRSRQTRVQPEGTNAAYRGFRRTRGFPGQAARIRWFVDSLTETIKQNGELFGAYRAVGQGGIAERVMRAIVGDALVKPN